MKLYLVITYTESYYYANIYLKPEFAAFQYVCNTFNKFARRELKTLTSLENKK